MLMPPGQIASLLPDCGFPPAARPKGLFISGTMFLLRKKALCLALPLSELETTLNQDRDVLCFCFTVTLFIFMGRMFHNCSCSGVWQTARGLLVQRVVFFSRKGPLGDNVGTDVWSEARFLNRFTSSEVPMGPGRAGKKAVCPPITPLGHIAVSWNISSPSVLRSMRWPPGKGNRMRDWTQLLTPSCPHGQVADPFWAAAVGGRELSPAAGNPRALRTQR